MTGVSHKQKTPTVQLTFILLVAIVFAFGLLPLATWGAATSDSGGATGGDASRAVGGQPGGGFGQPGAGQGQPGTPATQNYLSQIYIWSLGFVGIAALFAITLGGIMYMFSGTNITKTEQAKKWITNAIWGIVLAAASFLILNTINPDLVTHGFDLKVPEITLPQGSQSTPVPATTPPPTGDPWKGP